jgi:AcrR family transcriptional regulator
MMSGQAAVTRGQARQRILNCAEELFAEQGVEAVSLRTINATAGVSAGVLHYHFGSREVLVHELINRNMQQLMEQRARLLAPLTTQQQPLVRDIVNTLVQPLAQLALPASELPAEEETPAGPRYLRFIARLYADRSRMLDEVSLRYQETQRLYPLLLQRALPHIEPAVLDFRLAMANHAMLQMLSDLTRQTRPWLSHAASKVDNRQLAAMLVDFMSCGISGTIQEQTP